MLKDNLCDAPILSLPDGSKEFVVYCDASNQGLGYVLMKRGKVENATAEMLRGLDQLMERKEDGGMDKMYYDLRDMYGGHKYLADTNLHVHLEEIKVDKTLRFVEEPVEIIKREVKSLKHSRILIFKSIGTQSKVMRIS
ncbi:putative reverse transcriptase domain-containing protein [Tanacetum coccineum]